MHDVLKEDVVVLTCLSTPIVVMSYVNLYYYGLKKVYTIVECA